MMRFFLSAVAVMLLSGGVAFAVPANMPAGDYQVLDRAIQDALNQGRPIDYPWNARNGASGIISTKGETPRRRWPGCNGAECDDICRRYEFTYSKNGKFSKFSGVRCRAPSGGSQQWRMLNERFSSGDALPYLVAASTRSRTSRSQNPPSRIPPAQAPAAAVQQPQEPTYDKAIVTAIQRGLTSLLYYNGAVDGQFGPGARTALKAFLADYRHDATVEPTLETQSFIEAAATTTLNGADCTYATGTAYSVCGNFK